MEPQRRVADQRGRIEVRHGSVPVVALLGEFDLDNADRLRSGLDNFRPVETINVDLAQTTFMDSTVVNSIIEAHKDRLSMTIVGASDAVRRLLKITGVDT